MWGAEGRIVAFPKSIIPESGEIMVGIILPKEELELVQQAYMSYQKK